MGRTLLGPHSLAEKGYGGFHFGQEAIDEPIVLMPLGNHIQRKAHRPLITTDPIVVEQV